MFGNQTGLENPVVFVYNSIAIYRGRYVTPSLAVISLLCNTIGEATYSEYFFRNLLMDTCVYLLVDFNSTGIIL